MVATITRMPRRADMVRWQRAVNPAARTDLAGYSVGLGTAGTATLERRTGIVPPAALAGDVTTMVRATWTKAPTGGTWSIIAPAAFIDAGQEYAFTVFIRKNNAETTFMSIDWLDASGAFLSSGGWSSQLNTPPNTWERYRRVSTAPAGAAQARLQVRSVNPPVAGAVWDATGFMVVSGDYEETYWDGSTPATELSYYDYGTQPTAGYSRKFDYNTLDIDTPLALLADSLALSWDTNNYAHKVLGVTMPVVVLGITSGRAGTVEFLFETEARARNFAANLRNGSYFDVVYPERPLLQMRFALAPGAMVAKLDPITQSRWTVVAPILEVTA